eukprot:224364-Prorocentrum_lima.AAC.1
MPWSMAARRAAWSDRCARASRLCRKALSWDLSRSTMAVCSGGGGGSPSEFRSSRPAASRSCARRRRTP